METTNVLLRPEEAMRRLACGRSKLYELIGRGLLTRVHVSGRAARITAASVDAYIARLIEEAQQ